MSDRSASDNPRRLLLLSNDMGMGGGAEEQVIRLAYGFQARGWKTLITSMLPPRPMPPDFEQSGVPLVHLGMRRRVPDPRCFFRLAKLIREFRPDIVHSHMPHANLLARAVRLMQPYPVLVCTLHALNMAGVERDRKAILEAAHRLTDGFSDLTTAICHSAADYYLRNRAVPAAKMMVVPNGIDSRRFVPAPGARERMRGELGLEDRFTWLAVGRLELAKAYPTLLRALARLADRNATLLICGGGSLGEPLSALVRELNIGEQVKFLGVRSDIPDVMSAADAFALSSDTEGLPLVLLQASAAGLPIVATDVGGNAEAVVNNVTGFLTPARDIEAFAGAMSRLAALPAADRAALGHAGQARVQRFFEAERVVDRWENLFRELIDGAGRPRRRPARRLAESVASRLLDFEESATSAVNND